MTPMRRRSALAALGLGALFPYSAIAQQRGGRGMGRNQTAECASMDAPPLAANEAERKAHAVLDEIDRSMRYYNASQADARLLRIFTESMQARRVVEVGTSTGYSGIWIALGLRNSSGKLLTYEIDRSRAEIAAANFKRAGLAHLVTVVIGDAHEELKRLDDTIDLAFIDAEKEGYPDYLRLLRPRVRPGGLIVADNIRFPEPDPDYVKAITTDPQLETLYLNMWGTGLAVTLKKA
ncbi:MAG: O-methyltransferase [Hyphomicrobiales bacterium]|nr:O-methyltransferase [Hyphomicrobiales bacterium]